ncbi:MAG: glycosyltransferase family 9 protein [Luminiphilus sp.]|nr:glycosyltransferase family 9 protein [Luminiphilus sp.]
MIKPRGRRIGLIRLSAIGDVCHAVATVQALQRHAPEDDITWIIGRTEAALVSDLPGITFIVFDKKQGLTAFKNVLNSITEPFDVLLHMQVSLRANILAAVVPAKTKLGFPKHLSKELHGFVVNRRVPMPETPHVLEGFQHFAYALGVPPFTPIWSIPISKADQTWVRERLTTHQPYVVIAPSASNSERNWLVDRYAALANYLQAQGYAVVLTASPAQSEVALAQQITAIAGSDIINLAGQTNLKQLLAVVADASLVVAPDSGTAHMAVTQNTPVIGLYAHSNPQRTGPYQFQSLTIDAYHRNLQRLFANSAKPTPWGTRLKGAHLMKDIALSEVIAKVDEVLTGTPLRSDLNN